MKLIFVTRKVDRNDWTGFIFGWIEKLAANLDHLYVICQEKGDVSGLPPNVEVHSFGKDKGYGRIRQGYQLLVISYQLAKKADGFFCHMHPIYVIALWPVAKILGKKIVLWYTHKSADLKLRLALALADRVLTASKESFRLPSGKVKVVGHGIDTEKFKFPAHKVGEARPNGRQKFRIISVGRISPVKDYETLIKAVEILVNSKGLRDLRVEIFGRIGLPAHQSYLDSLVKFVHNADLEEVIKFQGEVAHEYVDEVYEEADVFVQMSQTGSVDKAVLEAAACGIPAMSSNEAVEDPLKKISPDLFFERNNPQELAEKLLRLKGMNGAERERMGQSLRDWVVREHNLDNLVKRIVEEFKK